MSHKGSSLENQFCNIKGMTWRIGALFLFVSNLCNSERILIMPAAELECQVTACTYLTECLGCLPIECHVCVYL